jgi:hypothetical protein
MTPSCAVRVCAFLFLAGPAFGQGDCGGAFTSIPEIQGFTASSPLRGQTVETRGVVSAARSHPDALGGFFLQDPEGDGDPRSSDGIFVFAPGAAVAEGDLVRIAGTVVEFFGQTELTDVARVEVCGRAKLAPMPLRAPWEDLEPFEGMWVRFADPLVVTDTFDLHRFGEIGLAVGGPLEIPTDHEAGRADPEAALRANRARSILLDDGSRRSNPVPVPHRAGRTLRRGDRIAALSGVIGFAFGAFRVHAVGRVAIVPASARPRLAPPRRALRLASFNLHNWWTTLDDGANGARGADSAAELARQRAKLVAALNGLRAHVIALQELENDAGAALTDLLAALNARRQRPLWCAVPDPEYPGGIGSTDRIKVGMIYRCGVVQRFGPPVADTDPVHAGGRPPLAQRFHVPGLGVSVVVAHLKSKDCSGARGADVDRGDGQGCFNARRTLQAEALLRFLDRGWRPPGEGVLLLGDFNAYAEEDPVRVLRRELVHLLRAGPGAPATHSYVFGGAHGLLDHAFATPALARRVTRAAVWHINADEPRLLGYDDDLLDPGEAAHELNPPRFWRPDAWRSSDHDPLVVDLAPALPHR